MPNRPIKVDKTTVLQTMKSRQTEKYPGTQGALVTMYRANIRLKQVKRYAVSV